MKAKKSKKNPTAASAPETVLVLRTCNSDMTGHGGFRWPESGPVEAPDWSPVMACGNGLHGWLWGAGNWGLKSQDPGARWLVVEVEKALIVDLGGKVKFPRGVVIAVCSKWADAMAIIRPKMPIAVSQVAAGDSGHASAAGHSGHASAAGHYGHASAAGDSGHASAAGDSGHASAAGLDGHASAAGHSGHASAAGDYGHASAAGHYGHASAAGHSGHASAAGHYGHASAAGDSGWAIAGLEGRVMAGKDGAITCLWHDGKRKRVLIGYVGEDGIEAGKWYAVGVSNGAATFVPVTVDCSCARVAAK